MKVLVTGGAGFIGSAVALKLARKGHKIIIYDLGAWDVQEDGAEYINGDIFDIRHLTAAVKRCDAVVHMIGLPDARTAQESPQKSFDLNVRSLQGLLESMRVAGVNRLLLPSSAAIYGAVDRSPVTEETAPKFGSVYSYHKYTAEKLAEAYSLHYGLYTTILRLFNVYGINGHGILNILLEKAMDGEPVTLYGEEQKRDFVHVSDVADVFASVLELNHRFEVYNVGSGVGISIKDLVSIVKEYFPTLTVQYGKYNGELYDSVADILKLQGTIGFSHNGCDSKLREAIRRQSSQNQEVLLRTILD